MSAEKTIDWTRQWKQQGREEGRQEGLLHATALEATVQEAQRRAYELVRRIHWDGVYYRNDIGYRAIRREQDKV